MINRSQRVQPSAATSGIDPARPALTQPQKRAHMAALFKGKTIFAHTRMQRLATRKAQARKLAQTLGTRKRGMAKTTRFARSTKAVASGARPAAKGPTSKKVQPRKGSHDHADDERGPHKERQEHQHEESEKQDQQHQDSQQQGSQQQDSQQNGQKHAEEQASRKASGRPERDARVGGLKKAAVPAWLDHTIALPNGPERQRAITEACCQALLSLRQQLSAPATPANGARIYLHLQQMQNVRSALGPLPSAGLGAIRQLLIDGAARRPASEFAALVSAARPQSAAPADAASRERLRSFNLLAGLMLLSGERPVTGHSGERGASTVRSLVAMRQASSGQVDES